MFHRRGVDEPETMSARTGMQPTLRTVQPVLMVREMPRAVRFYESIGFTLRGQDDPKNPRYAVIARDGVELHLQWHDAKEWEYPNDRPTYRFPVSDVDGLHESFSAIGPLDMTAVWDTGWGTREFHLRDPDLNGLQFYRPR